MAALTPVIAHQFEVSGRSDGSSGSPSGLAVAGMGVAGAPILPAAALTLHWHHRSRR